MYTELFERAHKGDNSALDDIGELDVETIEEQTEEEQTEILRKLCGLDNERKIRASNGNYSQNLLPISEEKLKLAAKILVKKILNPIKFSKSLKALGADPSFLAETILSGAKKDYFKLFPEERSRAPSQ